jgi:hypothetical protein
LQIYEVELGSLFLNLFFVEYASQADIIIFFVDYSSRAGWNKKEKIDLFY